MSDNKWLLGKRFGGRRRHPRRYSRYVWLMGFFSLFGFRYFSSHNVNDLFYFSSLGIFSTYFTARLASEMPDERYEENRLKARAATMLVPALALFAIGFGASLGLLSYELIVVTAALGFAATFIIYALAFWYYEKH
jgi:hypothetical protein